MQEICQSGSEGGARRTLSLPLSAQAFRPGTAVWTFSLKTADLELRLLKKSLPNWWVRRWKRPDNPSLGRSPRVSNPKAMRSEGARQRRTALTNPKGIFHRT
jgi:hypothetical protein